MKIEYTNLFNDVDIADVEFGECFIYNGSLHMKVNVDGLARVIDSPCIFPNAVLNLENNALNSISDGVIVSKVEAKILVNKEK